MAVSYRLHLDHDGIALRAGSDTATLVLATLDAPDFEARIGEMRDLVRTRAKLEADALAPIRLVLPDSQILFTDVPASGLDEIADAARVRNALEGATPYRLDELVWDWRLDGNVLRAAVVAKETIEEGEAFARSHGFDPVDVLGPESVGIFARGPVFRAADPDRIDALFDDVPQDAARSPSDLDPPSVPTDAEATDAEVESLHLDSDASDAESLESAAQETKPSASPKTVDAGETDNVTPLKQRATENRTSDRGQMHITPDAQATPSRAADPETAAESPVQRITRDHGDDEPDVSETGSEAKSTPAQSEEDEPAPIAPIAAFRSVRAPKAAAKEGSGLAVGAASDATEKQQPEKGGLSRLRAGFKKKNRRPPKAPPVAKDQRKEPVVTPFAVPDAVERPAPAAPIVAPNPAPIDGGRVDTASTHRHLTKAEDPTQLSGTVPKLATLERASATLNAPNGEVRIAPPAPPARQRREIRRRRTDQVVPAPVGASPSTASDMAEAESLTVFGARRSMPAERRTPRFFGLTLTLGLVAVMGLAALWSGFSEDPRETSAIDGAPVPQSGSVSAPVTGSGIVALPGAPAGTTPAETQEAPAAVIAPLPEGPEPTENSARSSLRVAPQEAPVSTSDAAPQPPALSEPAATGTATVSVGGGVEAQSVEGSDARAETRSLTAAVPSADATDVEVSPSGVEDAPASVVAAQEGQTGAPSDPAGPAPLPEETTSAAAPSDSPGDSEVGTTTAVSTAEVPPVEPVQRTTTLALLLSTPPANAAPGFAERPGLSTVSLTPPGGAEPAPVRLPRDRLSEAERRDVLPADPDNPLPAGSFLGADGLIVPLPEGALAPGGYALFTGQPPILPPARPDPNAPDQPPAAQVGEDEPSSGLTDTQTPDVNAAPIAAEPDIRPRPRPNVQGSVDLAPEDPQLLEAEDTGAAERSSQNAVVADLSDVVAAQTDPLEEDLASSGTLSEDTVSPETSQAAPNISDTRAADSAPSDAGTVALAEDATVSGAPTDGASPSASLAEDVDTPGILAEETGPSDALTEDSASDVNLADVRPRSRPPGLEETAEQIRTAAAQAEAIAQEQAAAAAAAAAALEDDLQTATARAVARTPLPRGRPSNIAQLAARAQNRSQAEQASQASARAASTPEAPATEAERRPSSAAQSASTSAAAGAAPNAPVIRRSDRVRPSQPSSALVARQATERNALRLSRVTLIGVYGSASQRRALVRLPSGRYIKVQVGDRLDGGQVSSIGRDELRYTKGGRAVTLEMPTG